MSVTQHTEPTCRQRGKIIQQRGFFRLTGFVPVIHHCYQQTVLVQQIQSSLHRRHAGFGQGGDVFVAVRQVAEVEHGGAQGLADVLGGVLVSVLNQGSARQQAVFRQARTGGFNGGGLNVEGKHAAGFAHTLRQ